MTGKRSGHAADGNHNVVIRASAGTGKTYQLTNRYIQLLAAGVPAEEVVASTFTRKAAGEILERVLERLAAAVVSDQERAELSRAVGHHFTLPDISALLHRLVTNLHRVRVTTLDAFFARVGRSAALEVGLPLGWTILDEPLDQQLRDLALSQLLSQEEPAALQRLVLLINQGGADRPVATRLRRLIDELYPIYQDSSDEAWRMPDCGGRLTDERFADLCTQLENLAAACDKRLKTALEKDVAHLRRGQWEPLFKSGLLNTVLAGQDTYHRKEIPASILQICQQLLRHVRAQLMDQWRAQTRATYELLQRFDKHYQKLKNERHGVRFDDVTLCLARNMASTTVETVLFRIDAPVAHLLVDEFQDTSPAQWRVLEPFAQWAIDPQRKGSFWCVGDVKQAIYGWRGGCARIFDVVDTRIKPIVAQSLTTSYRSSPPVIDFVNQVFGKLKQPEASHWQQAGFSQPTITAIGDWGRQFEPHTTAKTDLAGYVVVEVVHQENAGESHDSEEDAVEQVSVGPTILRAAECVEEWLKVAPGYTIGVLTRTNAAVAQMIFELRRRQITASEEGGNPLTDSAPVTAVLSLLQLADNPGHLPARYHVATSPLGEALSYTDWASDDDALRLSQKLRDQLATQGYGRVIRELVASIMPAVDDREAARLIQLADFAYEYEPLATLRPAEFVEWIQQRRAADPRSAPVRVMTIHQAKGLQFDIVVLPELNFPLKQRVPSCVAHRRDWIGPVERVCVYRRSELQRLLPPEYQQLFEEDEQRRVTESLCLTYVAMTRAIHALHLVVPPTRAGRTSLEPTPVGLLRATLLDGKPLEPDTVPYQHGNAHWYRQQPVRAAVATDSPLHRTPIRFSCDSRDLLHTSPSRLERNRRVRGMELLSFERSEALAWGTAMHAMFEHVRWLEDFQWDEQELRNTLRQLAYASGLPLREDPILETFRQALSQPTVQSALARSSYENNLWWTTTGNPADIQWEVYTERRILGRLDEQLLTGSIDRLVLARAAGKVVAADILDYKTDCLTADGVDRLEELVEAYRPQQDAYRSLVMELYQLPALHVRCRLLFVPAGLLREVEPK
ncbi:MAG: DNA helicase [Pirellulaceae bacterium]|nr:MAG: DNA helicase [Pirellulaceae bacterium]